VTVPDAGRPGPGAARPAERPPRHRPSRQSARRAARLDRRPPRPLRAGPAVDALARAAGLGAGPGSAWSVGLPL